MFSVCVYNLWVIANVILSVMLAVVSEKTIITAKMFIIAMQTSLAEKPHQRSKRSGRMHFSLTGWL